jgi:hypothetical protein
LTSADISWKTTTVATSSLNYGKSSAYGLIVSDLSTSSSTSHSTKLTGLENDTNYHFKITGQDENGSELVSDDYSFSTLPLPEITGFKITQIPDRPTSTLKANWETNVDASTVLKYSATGQAEQESAKSKLEKIHEVEISNLADNAKYTIYAQGKDQFGNLAQSDKTAYETPYDTRAPKIENIVYEVSAVGLMSGKAQIAISFTTDEPAMAYIEYGLGTGGGYTRQTSKDEALKTSFITVVSDLEPLSTYHFRIVAEDRSGNKTESNSFVFATQQTTPNIFDSVMRVLNNLLGWIKI